MDSWVPGLVVALAIGIGLLWWDSRREKTGQGSYTARRVAMLVAAVQPRCEEEIVAAMTCELGNIDSMASNLFRAKSKEHAGVAWSGRRVDTLPERMFLALGKHHVYVFEYRLKLFGWDIGRQVARWPRDKTSVVAEYTATMVYFVVATSSGETHALEASVISRPGGRPALDFLKTIGAVDYRSTL